MLAIILELLILFTFIKPVLAGEPPTQLSPDNGSTVSSTALSWQVPSYQLYSGNHYRVQVDDDFSFSSLDKDYYTKNAYYTPSLNPGSWYWRVKAKDIDENWSEWSSVWSFNLVVTTTTPSPILSPTQAPSFAPSSTSTPNPSTTASTSSSNFSISGVPPQINSDQLFTVSVNLSLPSKPNTDYYLTGAFKSVDGTRYFGLTKTNSGWVEYGNTNYANQYKITTDGSGVWSGNLEVKPDAHDSDYKGSGSYVFKVGRYTSSGSGPTWSNEATINIVGDKNETDEQTQSGDSDVLTATNPPLSTQNLSNSASIVKIKSRSSTSPNLDYQIATVAGISQTVPETEIIVMDKKPNLIIWLGLTFIIGGGGLFGYTYFLKYREINKINFKKIKKINL